MASFATKLVAQAEADADAEVLEDWMLEDGVREEIDLYEKDDVYVIG